MKRVSSFLVGLLFGIGLIVSGMTDPRKVLAFLDLAGVWDPSLAFVMVGAIIAAFAGFRLAAKRRTVSRASPSTCRPRARLTRALSSVRSCSGSAGALWAYVQDPRSRTSASSTDAPRCSSRR